MVALHAAGVELDVEQAKKWLGHAAEQGINAARSRLEALAAPSVD